ncbi:MAG: ABC transporter ATP-binding protein [Blastocatellia bacterium]|nr:ABC transporter ATP-binding protein [Blastocatellia bacterium]
MARPMVMTLFPETQAFAQRSTQAQPALSVRNLTKRFGNEIVLNDVSFNVAEGESLVLLGPSGSGKSTTLRIIAGLETPDSGEVVLHEREIEHLRARDRNVGVIFQNYALFPEMTVAENIGFGLKIRGVKARKRAEVVDRLLEMINLNDQRDKKPRHLSGGQQQRVAIARALAYEPEVLLFDESFSALDPHTRVGLRREIRQLLRRLRVPALFITHDQEEAMELGDHIAILNKGRLEQIGTPQEIYNDPQTEFVATFLGSANVLKGEWQDGLIRLDHGYFVVPPHEAFDIPIDDGERVKIIFRPEDVLLSTMLGVAESPYHLGEGEVTEVKFTGATEAVTIRLLNSPLRPSRPQLVTSISEHTEAKAKECFVKTLRSKWDARRVRLAPGNRVSIGLKAHKLLRGDTE